MAKKGTFLMSLLSISLKNFVFCEIWKNDSRGFAGVDDVAKLSAAALPAAYGKIKKAYVTRLGKEFELRKEDEPDANA